MKNEVKGVLMTFIELITKYEIVIPIVQRDYAHGRDESSAEQVRKGILTALHNAVINNESIELDYIYGSVPSESERFLPIDGQQRLTTLLLLHIYLSIKDDRFSELKERINDRFTYEIRDTSREFLSSLCKHGFELSNVTTPSEEIKNAPWYHLTYTEDPSVDAMLRTLDSINDIFKGVENGFSRLENGAVKFWVLTLQDFGLTDDLFIKMNSRGKRLSRYDNFKASFEEQLDKKYYGKDNPEHTKLINEWKDKIDNEWLDFFWQYFSKNENRENVAEQSLFRHILFFLRLLRKVDREAPYAEYRNLNEADYSQDIAVLSEYKNLQFVIYTLDHLEEILSDDDAAALWKKAITTEQFLYNERAFLFAKFYFGFILRESASEYNENFWHIYKNLLAGQREVNARDKQYNSSIDAVQIGAFVSYTQMLVEAIKTQGDVYYVLSKEENKFGFSYYKYEVDKSKYIVNELGVVDEQRKSAIWELEALPQFDGLIHNLLSDGVPIVNTQRVEAVQKANPILLLRTIQSFSEEWIAEKTYHGQWKIVVCQGDDVNDSWYKFYSGFEESPANCGEYIMTVLPDKSGTGLSGAVKKFWKFISTSSLSKNIEVELQDIIQNNLKRLTFGHSYYFTKYPEFWGKPGSDCFVGLVSKDECLHSQMRVFNNKTAGGEAWIDSYKHYNPFYLAVENKVKKIDPSATIHHSKGTNCQYRNELDFTLEIGNTGISMVLKESIVNLNWEIDLSKATSKYKLKAKSTINNVCIIHPEKAETITLNCSEGDGIDLIVQWINDVVIKK